MDDGFSPKRHQADDAGAAPGLQVGCRRDARGRYQRGHSGNPSGKRLGSVSLKAALIAELRADPQRARRIARKLLDLAEAGDIDAVKIVLDRIDGRPVQAIAADVTTHTPESRVLIYLPDNGRDAIAPDMRADSHAQSVDNGKEDPWDTQ